MREEGEKEGRDEMPTYLAMLAALRSLH